MLTVHRGERDAHGAASAMARHLQQRTLPPGHDDLLRDALGDHQPESGALSTAVPRSDADPRLAALLGVDPGRNLRHAEVVRLLAGRRADGAPVPGRPALRPTRTLGGALGLDPARPPDRDEIGHLLAGRHADGSELAAPDARGARRALGLLGVPPGYALTQEELDRIASGKRLDGSALRWRSASRFLFTPRISVAHLGLCLSAHKSVSVAWALAPVPSEAALIVQSHRDAVTAILLQVEAELGRARRGRGGAGGYDPGCIFWVQFHHYTDRPTPGGEDAGEAGQDAAGPAGSPQVHTHVAVPNVTLTADGHIGGLDLQRLNGRVKTLGGLYQAHLATALRGLGAEVGLDPDTGAAVLRGVPYEVCRALSRRTTEGMRTARRYAERIGLAWDELAPGRRVALIKQATQGDPRAPKSDDVGDWAAWRREAEALGWRPRPLLQPNRPVALPDPAERIQAAYEVSSGLLRGTLLRAGSLGEAEVRTAAARGLVASGIGDARDVDAVVQRIVRDGVQGEEEPVPLAWRASVDAHGQTWGRLAVAAHPERGGEGAEGALDAPPRRPPATPATSPAAAAIARLRGEGQARMVPGGYREAVEAAAELWEVRHAAHRGDPARRLAVIADSHGSVRDVAQAIRRRRRRLGLLGPDQVRVDAANGAGEGCELPLAPGDRVRLGCHVNAERADGGRGIIGRDGSVVELLLIEAAGVTVRNRQGRTGRVVWQRLRDPRSGRYLLAHADALAIGDVRDWRAGAERVLVLPSGSAGRRLPEALAQPGRDAGLFLLLSEVAERGQLAARGGDASATEDALWAAAAANLGQPYGVGDAAALLRLASEGRLHAVRSLLAAAHAREQRQADGLEPITLHRMLREHQDTAALQGLPALQGWLRDRPAPEQVAAAVAVLAAGLAEAAGRGLGAAGRRLRQAASARRVSWLARSTLGGRLHDESCGGVILDALAPAGPDAGAAPQTAASALAVAASVRQAVVQGLWEASRRLADRRRSDRAAWRALATLHRQLEGRREQDAVLEAVLALRPALDSRDRVLALALPSVASGVRDAVRGGLVDAGRLRRLARAQRRAWLARATLHRRLRGQQDEAGVAQVVVALRAGVARRARSLEALAGVAVALQEAVVEAGTGFAAQLRADLLRRRAAWLAAGTLHQRARQRREDQAIALVAGRLGAAARLQARALQQAAELAAGLPEAVGRGLVPSMVRLRWAARERRAAWVARSGLAHQLRRRQEEAAVLRVLQARHLAAREQDLAIASVTAAAQGVREAALRTLSGIGPALAKLRARRNQAAEAARAGSPITLGAPLGRPGAQGGGPRAGVLVPSGREGTFEAMLGAVRQITRLGPGRPDLAWWWMPAAASGVQPVEALRRSLAAVHVETACEDMPRLGRGMAARVEDLAAMLASADGLEEWLGAIARATAASEQVRLLREAELEKEDAGPGLLGRVAGRLRAAASTAAPILKRAGTLAATEARDMGVEAAAMAREAGAGVRTLGGKALSLLGEKLVSEPPPPPLPPGEFIDPQTGAVYKLVPVPKADLARPGRSRHVGLEKEVVPALGKVAVASPAAAPRRTAPAASPSTPSPLAPVPRRNGKGGPGGRGGGGGIGI